MLTVVAAIVAAIYRPGPPTGRPLPDGWSIYSQTKEESEPARVRHGRFVVRDDQGRQRVTGSFKDDEPSGRWTIRHPSGRVAIEGSVAEGVPSGQWFAWHANRQDAAAISFREPDRRDTQVGDRQVKQPIAQSIRKGEATFWDAFGEVTARGPYRDDRREGIWTGRGRDGNVTEMSYLAGLRHGRRDAHFLGHEVDWEKLLKRATADLESDDQQRQVAAIGTLRHCGELGASALARRLATADRRLTLRLLQAMRTMGERASAAEQVITAKLGSDDDRVAIVAATALVSVANDASEPLQMLFDRLMSNATKDRMPLVIETGGLGPRAVPLLEQQLLTKDADRRQVAFQILVAMLHDSLSPRRRNLCKRAVVDALHRIAAGSDEELAEAARDVLDDYPYWDIQDDDYGQPFGYLLPIVG